MDPKQKCGAVSDDEKLTPEEKNILENKLLNLGISKENSPQGLQIILESNQKYFRHLNGLIY